MHNLASWLLVLQMTAATLFSPFLPPPTPVLQDEAAKVSLVDTYLTGSYNSQQMTSANFCSGCSKHVKHASWDLQRDTGNFVPASGLRFEALGVEFQFYTADDQALYGIDVERMQDLLRTLGSSIPQEYKRRYVETIIVILSSDDYCLHYDNWTAVQRNTIQMDNLSSYFTSESSQQNIGGCCLSFPGNNERERVIWLPVGKAMRDMDKSSLQFVCAYSFHLSATEEVLLLSKFIHEVTHALTITRTMPTLEAYGFDHNLGWELQQKVRGREVPELLSVEALAYDTSLKLVQQQSTLSFFNILPNPDAPISDSDEPAPEDEPEPEFAGPDLNEQIESLESAYTAKR